MYWLLAFLFALAMPVRGLSLDAQGTENPWWAAARPLATPWPICGVSDLDGDGDVDLLLRSQGDYAWMANNGSGVFTLQNSIALNPDAYAPSTIDYDFDGDRDLLQLRIVDTYDDNRRLVELYLYRNNGQEMFEAADTIFSAYGGYYGSLTLADYDEDGDMDLAMPLTNFSSFKRLLHYFRNDNSVYAAPQVLDSAYYVFGGVRSIDMDSDGRTDIVTTESDCNYIYWYKNLASGGFDRRRHVVTDYNNSGFSVVDVDGDGHQDILGHFMGADDFGLHEETCKWYRGDGDGRYAEAGTIPLARAQRYRSVFDVDLDGDPDLVLHCQGVLSWRENVEGRFDWPDVPIDTLNGTEFRFRSLDLNGDGARDILIVPYGGADSGPAIWFKNLSPTHSLELTDLSKTLTVDESLTVYPLPGNGEGTRWTTAVDTSATLGRVTFEPYTYFIDYRPPAGFVGDDRFDVQVTDCYGRNGWMRVYITILPRWIDGGWSGPGLRNSPDARVYVLTVWDDALYLGGAFEYCGTQQSPRLAAWTGHCYRRFNLGFNNAVRALEPGAWGLYVGGAFSEPYNRLLRLDAQGIGHDVDYGVDGPVYAIKKRPDDGLFFGGAFHNITAEMHTDYLAYYHKYEWQWYRPGPNDFVTDIEICGDSLLIAGAFTQVGANATQVNGVAGLYRGWFALGNGLAAPGWRCIVRDLLVVSANEIYAGVNQRKSSFVAANGDSVEITTVYKWDGHAWTALPGHFMAGLGSPQIHCLLMHNGLLYVGGLFTDLPVTLQDGSTLEAGVQANGVAVWDGVSWSALGSGLNGRVEDLEIWDGRLYAGGAFTMAGGNPAHHFAWWTFPEPGGPPVAVDDQIDVPIDSACTLCPLENDSDPDGEALRIWALLTAETAGTVSLAADSLSVVYTAPAGFTGMDHFLYVVSDPLGRKDTAAVHVEVTAASGVASGGVPRAFALHQNFPNPFNPETTLGFDLPMAVKVKLMVYDARGRLVQALCDAAFRPGRHEAVWNGRDRENREVPSGVYLCRIEAGPYQAVRKMLLLR